MNKLALENNIHSLFPELSESSLNLFSKHTSFLKLPRRTQLIKEGNRHSYFYFILKGCAKSFYQKEAREVCMWFAFENEVIATTTTYIGLPSRETLELIEDSELIRFDIEKIKELSKTDISVIHLLKKILLEHTLCIEERLYQLQFMSKEERYKELVEEAPEILQRVSLTDIASLLGMNRETLSRLRANK